MRKAEIFFDAITNIGEELIDDALDYRFTKRYWRRYLSAAACLALAATVCFGAIRMGLIDGMGGGGMNASSDCAAPEQSVAESNSSASSSASSSTASGSAAEDGGAMNDASAPAAFEATVLSVEENYLLVEPAEGEEILASADRFLVDITSVEELPEMAVGSRITITYDGFIRESYPAQIDAIAIDSLRQELGKD